MKNKQDSTKIETYFVDLALALREFETHQLLDGHGLSLRFNNCNVLLSKLGNTYHIEIYENLV